MKKPHITLVTALLLSVYPMACDAVTTDTPKDRPPKDEGKDSFSFVMFGDLHYCEETLYDLDAMLKEKPGDHRQITGTYAPVTRENWDDLMSSVKNNAKGTVPPVKCIIQLGDMSEGLANTPGGADKMAHGIIETVERCGFKVPFLMAKGNHDITGVGAECRKEANEAFLKHITPFIKAQTGETVSNANYIYRQGKAIFVFLDAYNKEIDQIEFLKNALENTEAEYRFVCMHEPAIPVSERCWHYLKSSEDKRNEFLKVLAQNKAIFLCGHLHRYSVLRRNTEWGPIIQVMANSATDLKRKGKPSYEFTTGHYGEYLVDWKPEYSPDNKGWRRETLKKEAQYVDYYMMNNLAGYGIISINDRKKEVILRYYPAFSDIPHNEINLTELYNR